MYKKRNDQKSYIRVFFIRYWTRTFKGYLSVLPHKKRNSGIAYVAGKTSWKWLADESGGKKRKKEAEGKPSTPIFLPFSPIPFNACHVGYILCCVFVVKMTSPSNICQPTG